MKLTFLPSLQETTSETIMLSHLLEILAWVSLVFGNQAVCSIIYRPLENTAREKGGYFHFVWKGQASPRLEPKHLRFREPGRHFGHADNRNTDRHSSGTATVLVDSVW